MPGMNKGTIVCVLRKKSKKTTAAFLIFRKITENRFFSRTAWPLFLDNGKVTKNAFIESNNVFEANEEESSAQLSLFSLYKF